MDTIETTLGIWGNCIGFEGPGFDEACEWGEIRGNKPPTPVSSDPPIVIPRDWRYDLAHWPHERWSRWRRYSGEFQATLDHPPDAEEIRGADHAAFDLLRTDGGMD